jgi:branched-chain amino acid transport system ATP-binding protein
MAENVLHIENVTMQFGGVVAVNNLNLDVNKGEIVALIGPNGAGKTTAFNCVTGVYEPTNGKVEFMGEVIAENHPQGKMKKLYAGENMGMYTDVVSYTPDVITSKGIARTFQNIRLFSKLSVFENVLIAKHMRAKQNFFSAALHLNGAEEKRMREEAMALLAEQGLDKYKDDVAGSLPYGIQRRLETVNQHIRAVVIHSHAVYNFVSRSVTVIGADTDCGKKSVILLGRGNTV